MRRVTTRELLAALEGVALFRGLFNGTDEDARRRIEELRAIIEESGFASGIHVPTVEVAE